MTNLSFHQPARQPLNEGPKFEPDYLPIILHCWSTYIYPPLQPTTGEAGPAHNHRVCLMEANSPPPPPPHFIGLHWTALVRGLNKVCAPKTSVYGNPMST